MSDADVSNVQFIGGERNYFSRKIPAELALELNRLLELDFAKNDGRSEVRGNQYLESRLLAIRDQWPGCVDPYIALFKFYFRVARYVEAERIVWSAMRMIAERNGFSHNYRRLKSCTIDWLSHDSDQRHFLFCLKALGVIRLRRGKVFLAKTVLSKLAELDPHDEIGGGNYLYIAESF
ncbi:hypothetical protein [Halioxenophilus sp. WMMB6]|uniref:hypothetical protein n=1 Tax=Halioxenophilus sp. WMMB6 TaxID=3073815 RepID=UPI00295E5C4F|nr:hypothetical protein [Halioxenophilus sp. WMMB6]